MEVALRALPQRKITVKYEEKSGPGPPGPGPRAWGLGPGAWDLGVEPGTWAWDLDLGVGLGIWVMGWMQIAEQKLNVTEHDTKVMGSVGGRGLTKTENRISFGANSFVSTRSTGAGGGRMHTHGHHTSSA